ncbi:gluconolactonase [Mycolicibacterium parafortuitum]|uniref:Gluconolactonase n=2 Tax=Mycolicibacterium parafortuitum TaxID=39692 RepID=A0A7I7UBP2_MYCPF|nr:gluconolactonase [Mycolicibacterium parafortuitum]
MGVTKVDIMARAEQLTAPCSYHGEGPFWDNYSARLMCVDVLASAVISIDEHGRTERHQVPSRAATLIRRRRSGGFVIGTDHGILLADSELSAFTPFADIVCDPSVRTNDGGCDPLGALVIGTMAYDETPGRGAVYRVTADTRSTVILAPVSISNGVQWSADGRRAFYIDSPTQRVDVFDVDSKTGEWSNRRTHIDLGNVEGIPDGMTIDCDDGLWVAFWGGGAVLHFDEMGLLNERIEVPGASQVSSCTFGGRDLSTLFITTSRQGLPSSVEPEAGAVFSISTATRGAVQAEFAG